MDTQLTEDLRHLFRESRRRYIELYLNFVQQHRYDFVVLQPELENIRQAFVLGREEEDLSLLAQMIEALAIWATVEEALGNYERARDWWLEQIRLWTQSEGHGEDVRLVAFRQLARLATLRGDYDEAQQFLEHQLGILEEQQNAREQVDILLELSKLHQTRQGLSQAELRCQQGLEIAQRIGYRLGVVDASRQLASIRYDKRSLEEARELYRAALHVAVEIGDNARASEIREKLIVVEAAMGRDIFISYNHRDRDFVEDLARDLKAAGLKVWWDK